MYLAIYSTTTKDDLRQEFQDYYSACQFVDAQLSGCVLDTNDDVPVAHHSTHQFYIDLY